MKSVLELGNTLNYVSFRAAVNKNQPECQEIAICKTDDNLKKFNGLTLIN